jgi:hypothetical protein
MMALDDQQSPNTRIDAAINALLKDIKEKPDDIAVKILNTAVNWEKVKNHIREKDDGFDPDDL